MIKVLRKKVIFFQLNLICIIKDFVCPILKNDIYLLRPSRYPKRRNEAYTLELLIHPSIIISFIFRKTGEFFSHPHSSDKTRYLTETCLMHLIQNEDLIIIILFFLMRLRLKFSHLPILMNSLSIRYFVFVVEKFFNFYRVIDLLLSF